MLFNICTAEMIKVCSNLKYVFSAVDSGELLVRSQPAKWMFFLKYIHHLSSLIFIFIFFSATCNKVKVLHK